MGPRRRGRLLLFVALLFGIVGMHTLGHPTGHATSHQSMAAPMTAPMAAHPDTHIAPSQATADEHPMPGDGSMDPLGVCLAVLGSFTLLLLTAAALRPLIAPAAPGPAPRGMAFAQRPHPPPPRTTLSRLSVLRI
ncbi:hypothetical protein GTY65_11090 [Streptomyces sp. SID8379]|nr:DUF6153 family protein [Streptomyces sp. SID8379]MYW64609.1 hypothetical protein [Streptomyces sp. SID8379]